MRGAVVVAGVLGSAVLGWVVPAGADPPHARQITLDCGADGTYTVNVFSNGTWSPGLDADSNAVFVPTAFGESNGTFYPSDGSDPISFTEPPAVKSEPKNKAPIFSCTFHDEFSDSYGRGVVDGSAIGFKTPARG